MAVNWPAERVRYCARAASYYAILHALYLILATNWFRIGEPVESALFFLFLLLRFPGAVLGAVAAFAATGNVHGDARFLFESVTVLTNVLLWGWVGYRFGEWVERRRAPTRTPEKEREGQPEHRVALRLAPEGVVRPGRRRVQVIAGLSYTVLYFFEFGKLLLAYGDLAWWQYRDPLDGIFAVISLPGLSVLTLLGAVLSAIMGPALTEAVERFPWMFHISLLAVNTVSYGLLGPALHDGWRKVRGALVRTRREL